jgi:hypothetical protein
MEVELLHTDRRTDMILKKRRVLRRTNCTDIMKLHDTSYRPVVLYGGETWTLS